MRAHLKVAPHPSQRDTRDTRDTRPRAPHSSTVPLRRGCSHKLAAFCRFSKFSNGFQAEPDATLRLTAERDKNLSAASGVAYIRLGAILTFLAAPNLAPKSIRNQHTTVDALCPPTPFPARVR